MRGAPRQWDVGSLWLGDGGIYPGMGDTIGLAGTSPELVESGLWNDGGAVGDPPFDPAQAAYFESSIGAGMTGAPAGGSMPANDGGQFSGYILTGAIATIALGGLTFWIHDHFTGGQNGHSPIRWTIGEIALVTVAGAAGKPLLVTLLTWISKAVPPVAAVTDYVRMGGP